MEKRFEKVVDMTPRYATLVAFKLYLLRYRGHFISNTPKVVSHFSDTYFTGNDTENRTIFFLSKGRFTFAQGTVRR